MCLCRLAPVALYGAHLIAAKNGRGLVGYTGYSLLVLAQKALPCGLLFTAADTYLCALLNVLMCALVFMVFLRWLTQHGPAHHPKATALLHFTCIFASQLFVFVDGARWPYSSSAVAYPTDSWRHVFHVGLLCYVACAILWCLGRVVWLFRTVRTGPVAEAHRKRSFHKSSLNSKVWIAELTGYSDERRTFAHKLSLRKLRLASGSKQSRHTGLANEATRRHRISSIVAAKPIAPAVVGAQQDTLVPVSTLASLPQSEAVQ